ncbi:tRNA uridine-5-carboxymethylaminomethyl(34) synthesis GTPase MnmE [Roseitranquillus sediminis]|uniref:tRNA uridine-5-carboxymethylaminomethyl(34) synthesis GTPase MnmE n=1 Tax=Roseitranquillus sediminis TaxID=2809051 RepID=UPI001D0C2E32|nr:tRNA uridine-5-carboxymethylaminomethyl(34) synthesis GTPase MnmE [Roseitranquillus sediminis]MBM9596226.1 tRNA uridine-5-carboxymethylaminomethyl(34) synthesis GTPase MnmE [Roseitranquillus sediminis]
MNDTIFALATARGKAGVSVVRLSGPLAHEAASRLCGSLPQPRQAGLRVLRGASGDILDEALVLTFAEGASFTGEQVSELHLHGSVAVVRVVLAEIAGMEGLRQADAGEFTRRALLNGRLDLTRVEGLADLIDAETEAQRRLAQRMMSGALARRVEEWRQRLLEASALLEASIDFSDEEIPDDLSSAVLRGISVLRDDWEREIAGVGAAEMIRDGFEVAIIGPPNAGKSTLLNRIAGRDVAITSELAGTTRDILEVRMDLGGLPVTLLDTAGLRQGRDAIEVIGVERSRKRAAAADLRVFLSATEEELEALYVEGDLRLEGKADLRGQPQAGVSGLTGAGVPEMLGAIEMELARRMPASATATRARHADALRGAAADLRSAENNLAADALDIAAADLRAAVHRLDVLVGRVDVEDILGHIFASFCIGK